MLKMTLLPYELPFKHPFSISRDSKKTQPLLIVKLEARGYYGLGETTANSYYNMTVPRLIEDLEQISGLLSKTAFTHPEELWQTLSAPLKENPFALCAVDLAAWDMYAKMQDKKLYELWNPDITHNALTDYTIGIDTIDNLVRRTTGSSGPVYKTEVGTDEAIAIVKALRKESRAEFRVDANCAWGLQQSIENAQALKGLGAEF